MLNPPSNGRSTARGSPVPNAGAPPPTPVLPASNVRQMGAFGNGSHDDTAIVQAMIADATGSGTIYLPTGTYRITSTLTVPTGVSIVGDGQSRTTISYEGTGSAITTADAASLIGISDLAIVATTNACTVGIDVVSAYDVSIRRVTVNGSPGSGFTIACVRCITKQTAGTNPANVSIVDCNLLNAGGGSGAGLMLDADVVDEAGPQGIRVWGGVFLGNGHGIHCTTNPTNQQVRVLGAIVEGNYLSAIKADRLIASAISDCHFENGGTQTIILLQIGDTTGGSCRGVEVSGCFFKVGAAEYAISSMSATGQYALNYHGNEFVVEAGVNNHAKSAIRLGPQVNCRVGPNDVFGPWTLVASYATKELEQSYQVRSLLIQDEDGVQINGTLRHGQGTSPAVSLATVAMGDANQTLTQYQYNAKVIECTGALTADRELVFPIAEQDTLAIASSFGCVKNSTTGGHNITAKTAAGASYAVHPGEVAPLWWNTTGVYGLDRGPNFGSQNIVTTGNITGANLRATALGVGLVHSDGSGNQSSSLAVNADIAVGAAVDGNKVTPNFGSQNVLTSGTLGAGASTLGNTTVGTLGASGASTLAAVSCTTLAPSGASTMQAVTCTTLAPSGASTLQAVTCTTLAPSGASTLQGVTCTTLTASSTVGLAATTCQTLTVSALGAGTVRSSAGGVLSIVTAQSITGQLTNVTDANAKAVLTSIIAALTAAAPGPAIATDNTT